MSQWQPAKLNAAHEALIDLILEHPTAKQAELGEKLNPPRTGTWVGLLVRSDVFQDALKRRRAERRASMDAAITQGLEQIAVKSLDNLKEQLNMGFVRDPATLVDVANMSLNGLGRGKQVGHTVGGVDVNLYVGVTPEDLDRARSRMKDGEYIEGTFEEVPAGN